MPTLEALEFHRRRAQNTFRIWDTALFTKDGRCPDPTDQGYAFVTLTKQSKKQFALQLAENLFVTADYSMHLLKAPTLTRAVRKRHREIDFDDGKEDDEASSIDGSNKGDDDIADDNDADEL